jgi:hypothetical protein
MAKATYALLALVVLIAATFAISMMIRKKKAAKKVVITTKDKRGLKMVVKNTPYPDEAKFGNKRMLGSDPRTWSPSQMSWSPVESWWAEHPW